MGVVFDEEDGMWWVVEYSEQYEEKIVTWIKGFELEKEAKLFLKKYYS